MSTDEILSLSPASLVRFLDEATGKEWRDWLPESIDQFFGKLSTQQLDYVMACQVAVTNADVFEDWPLFHHCAVAFNGRRCNFGWLDRISYMEAAWACEVLKELAPGHDFGPGVIRYLRAICTHDGLEQFPWIGGGGIILTGGLPAATLEAVKELKPSEIDEEDPHAVQLLKLICGYEYIREARK